MPVSLDDFLNGNSPTSNSNSPVSSKTPMSLDNFLGSSQGNTTPQQNTQQPSAPQSSSPSGGGGFFGNVWSGIKNGYNHVQGGAEGLISGLFNKDINGNTNTGYTPQGQGLYEGFMHPDAQHAGYQKITDQVSNAASPYVNAGLFGAGSNHTDPTISNAIVNFGMHSAADPLSYIPFGKVASVVGKGAKLASDAVGATPHIAQATSKVANMPGVKQAIGSTKDTFGRMFTKDYGTSPDTSPTLQTLQGSISADKYAIEQKMKELSDSHNLNPAQLAALPHVIEGETSKDAKVNQAAQQLKDIMSGGFGSSHGKVYGTDAELRNGYTGQPLRQGFIQDYFPHRYNNTPEEITAAKAAAQQGKAGLSTSGAFNQTRSFDTLKEAMAHGLSPELNPYKAIGQRLGETSNSVQTDNAIKQLLYSGVVKNKAADGLVESDIKPFLPHILNVPGKNPGETEAIMQKYFMKPEDRSAIKESIDPTRPTGVFGAADKLNNMYNKGFLINPAPHMHNIYTNGVGLGEANPSYIKEAYDNISNGIHDPNYEKALYSGAISKAAGKSEIDPASNIFGKILNVGKAGMNASHDLLWNNDAAIRTALFRGASESGASPAEAAAHTNKFMVDYQNLTPFEKQYIKPLINFYAWKKGNIPLQASQMINQTPKYALYDHAKNAISQAMSGNPTDANGRIDVNQQLDDGSHTMVDPYSPMDEIGKIANKGILPWLYNSQNPIAKWGEDQATSLAQVAGLPIQNKFPIYNPDAPFSNNLAKGVAHTLGALNPLNSSAAIGATGLDQGNTIKSMLGLPTKDKPGETPTELATKLLGGFTSRNNPATDARNQAYKEKDSAINRIKYDKSQGIPISRADKKAAYKKIPIAR